MVRTLPGRPEVLVCEECGFGYADRRTAAACEAYCAEHKMCSLEITSKAVYRPS